MNLYSKASLETLIALFEMGIENHTQLIEDIDLYESAHQLSIILIHIFQDRYFSLMKNAPLYISKVDNYIKYLKEYQSIKDDMGSSVFISTFNKYISYQMIIDYLETYKKNIIKHEVNHE